MSINNRLRAPFMRCPSASPDSLDFFQDSNGRPVPEPRRQNGFGGGLGKALHSQLPVVAKRLRAHTMSDHIPLARTHHTRLMKIPTKHVRRLRKSDVSDVQKKIFSVQPHEFD